MKLRTGIVFVYGILLLIGGVIGYIKANSLASLLMGGGFALLTIASAVAIAKNHRIGNISALILSGILTLFFTFRFIKTETFMPSGLMAVLSLLVVLSLLCHLRKKCFSC